MLLSTSDESIDTSTRELSPRLSFGSEPSSPDISLGSIDRRRCGNIFIEYRSFVKK